MPASPSSATSGTCWTTFTSSTTTSAPITDASVDYPDFARAGQPRRRGRQGRPRHPDLRHRASAWPSPPTRCTGVRAALGRARSRRPAWRANTTTPTSSRWGPDDVRSIARSSHRAGCSSTAVRGRAARSGASARSPRWSSTARIERAPWPRAPRAPHGSPASHRPRSGPRPYSPACCARWRGRPDVARRSPTRSIARTRPRAHRLGELRQPRRARGDGLGDDEQVRRGLPGQAVLRRLRVRRRRRVARHRARQGAVRRRARQRAAALGRPGQHGASTSRC